MSTRRKIAIIAAIIAGLALVPIGFHFYLRWDCARHRAELARKGEKLKIQEIAPVAPLAAENGAPALRNALALMPTFSTSNLVTDLPQAMVVVSPGRALIGWQQAELWRGSDEVHWTELRSGLEKYAPVIEQMQRALENTAFDFNLNYAQGARLTLPHITQVKHVSQLLRSSALYHLHEHNYAMASRDLNSLIASIGVLEKEPLMISQIVRTAQAAIAVNAMWEALQADAWTDAQLAEMQRRWAAQEFIEPFLPSLMMERAMGLQEFDQCRESHIYYKGLLGTLSTWGRAQPSNSPLQALADQIEIWTWPLFGSYQTERRCLNINQIGIHALRETGTNPSCAEVRKKMNLAMVRLGYQEGSAGSEQLIPFCAPNSLEELFTDGAVRLLASVSRPFKAKTEAEIVTTAIALKRYQLRHGSLPNDLMALVPDLLASIPCDPMNGQSLQYRLSTNSTFLLYSVGTDGEDNGGDPTDPKENGPKGWLSGRDWVWPQPASAEEVEQYNRRMREARKKAEQKQRGRRKAPPP